MALILAAGHIFVIIRNISGKAKQKVNFTRSMAIGIGDKPSETRNHVS